MLTIGSAIGGVAAAVLIVPVLYRAGTLTIQHLADAIPLEWGGLSKSSATRRTGTRWRSAVAALWTGAVTVLLVQPYILPHWSGLLFGEPWRIAWPWWMVLGAGANCLVCLAGRRTSVANP